MFEAGYTTGNNTQWYSQKQVREITQTYLEKQIMFPQNKECLAYFAILLYFLNYSLQFKQQHQTKRWLSILQLENEQELQLSVGVNRSFGSLPNEYVVYQLNKTKRDSLKIHQITEHNGKKHFIVFMADFICVKKKSRPTICVYNWWDNYDPIESVTLGFAVE
eukprot:UN34239